MSSAARFAGATPLECSHLRRLGARLSSSNGPRSVSRTHSGITTTTASASGSGQPANSRVVQNTACKIRNTGTVTKSSGVARRDLLALAAATFMLPGSATFAPNASVAASNAIDTPEARAALREALVASIAKTKAPAVLRLVFHDAGTRRVKDGDGGMNASVRFELGRPESFGLKRGLGPVTAVYEQIRDGPASGLSFADTIAAAGAYAVELTGGPQILSKLRFGRVDATVADPENRMPTESASGEETREIFGAMGYSVRETIALAGAHTIGGKGFGEPYVFDNEYYKTMLVRPWDSEKNPNASKDDLEMGSHVGLTSDKNLAVDDASLEFIKAYANDQSLFFKEFTEVYVKMTESGAMWRE